MSTWHSGLIGEVIQVMPTWHSGQVWGGYTGNVNMALRSGRGGYTGNVNTWHSGLVGEAIQVMSTHGTRVW